MKKLPKYSLKKLIDKKKTFELKEGFEEYIKENIEIFLNNDILITMKRKGNVIFEDLKRVFPEFFRTHSIAESEILLERERIHKKDVLIIDDSINTGRSVKRIIKVLNSPYLKPNKITILNVLVCESTIKTLKEDYPEIEFMNYRIIPDAEFGKFYSEHMFGYLDYICRSLDKDHHIISLKLDNPLSKKDLLKCFNNELFSNYEVKRIIKREGEYKISVKCVNFFHKIKRNHLKNIKDMVIVKVRFFLNSTSETYSTLDVVPILIPESIPIGECEEDEDFCSMKRVGKTMPNNFDTARLCLWCVQYYISLEFIEKFMTYLKERLAHQGVFIISEERKAPSPMEFFRWRDLIEVD
jgi:hypothetical protein